MTPLAPLTMQELKLSQTLDGANMSPYHTTGEFATSLVLLRSRQVMYTCFAEHKVLLSLSQICACPTNMSTCQMCTTTSSVYGVNLLLDRTRYHPFSRKILLLSTIITCILYLTNKKYLQGTHCKRFSARR